MKKIIPFLLISSFACGQTQGQTCPTAATMTAFVAGPQMTTNLMPAIYPGGCSFSSLTFTWASPVTATLSGVNTATLTVSVCGVYTLTLRTTANPNCMDITTHNVKGCSEVGIEEISQDHGPVKYVDLLGNPSSAQKNTILIEQRGTVRRKVIIIE